MSRLLDSNQRVLAESGYKSDAIDLYAKTAFYLAACSSY